MRPNGPDWRLAVVLVLSVFALSWGTRPALAVTVTKVEWVCNGGWTNDGLGAPSSGGACAAGNASKPITSLVVTADTAYTVSIYGIGYNGGGSVRWRIDGGTWSAVISTQTGSLQSLLYATTGTLSAGAHTVEVENNAGYTYVDYVNVNAEDPPATTTTTAPPTTSTTVPETTTTTVAPTTTTTTPPTTTTTLPPSPEGATKEQMNGVLLAAGIGVFYASARFAERIGRRD